MMEPVIERISDAIRSRLELFDFVDTVIRPMRIETEPVGDRKLTLTQISEVRNEGLSCPGNPPLVAFDTVFRIAGELRPSETEDTPIDTLKNRFAAEIRAALTTGDEWWQFGGNAINADIGSAMLERNDENASVFLELLVQYRHPENDATA